MDEVDGYEEGRKQGFGECLAVIAHRGKLARDRFALAAYRLAFSAIEEARDNVPEGRAVHDGSMAWSDRSDGWYAEADRLARRALGMPEVVLALEGGAPAPKEAPASALPSASVVASLQEKITEAEFRGLVEEIAQILQARERVIWRELADAIGGPRELSGEGVVRALAMRKIAEDVVRRHEHRMVHPGAALAVLKGGDRLGGGGGSASAGMRWDPRLDRLDHPSRGGFSIGCAKPGWGGEADLSKIRPSIEEAADGPAQPRKATDNLSPEDFPPGLYWIDRPLADMGDNGVMREDTVVRLFYNEETVPGVGVFPTPHLMVIGSEEFVRWPVEGWVINGPVSAP